MFTSRRSFLFYGVPIAIVGAEVSHSVLSGRLSASRARNMQGVYSFPLRETTFASSRTEFPFANNITLGLSGMVLFKQLFKNIGVEKKDIQAVYTNFYLSVPGGGIEILCAESIQVSAYLIRESGHSAIGFAADGTDSVRIAPGEVGRISWQGETLGSGESYYILTLVSGPPGAPIPVNYQSNVQRKEAGVEIDSRNMGEIPDLGAKLAGEAGKLMYGPSIVIGKRTSKFEAPCLGVIADSIGMGAAEQRSEGTTTGQRGFIGRALEELEVDFAKFGVHGATITSFMGKNFARRRGLFFEAVSAVIFQVGNNDLGENVADVLSNWRAMIDEIAQCGLLPSMAILPGPKTKSSDGWRSLAGQSVSLRDANSAGNFPPGTRFAFRQAIEEEVGHRIKSTVDPLEIWSAKGRSDFWRPGFTDDGVHPSLAAHMKAVPLMAQATSEFFRESTPTSS